jgi:3-methyladenine DNA glycosylase AlkD
MRKHISAEEVILNIKAVSSADYAVKVKRFFKTGPGEYGEGDVFWGIRNPEARNIAKKYTALSLSEIEILIDHLVHEVRLVGLLILVHQFKKAKSESEKARVFQFTWAQSPHLWTRRIAVVASLYFIRKNRFEELLSLCIALRNDSEPLMHKACGWMLREVGKKNVETLRDFLNQWGTELPRTTIRYAIERFEKDERLKLLYATKNNLKLV